MQRNSMKRESAYPATILENRVLGRTEFDGERTGVAGSLRGLTRCLRNQGHAGKEGTPWRWRDNEITLTKLSVKLFNIC